MLRGDHRISAHDTKSKCSRSDTKASTLPTCARLKTKENGSRQQTSAAFDEHTTPAFPYGLGLNDDLQQEQQKPSHANGTVHSATHVTKSEPKSDLVETYLRFPLTSCHHLIPFQMPETFLNESTDNTLPCGCWTGRAPDAHILEAALFVDYFGGETSFKSVWDVTGLGPGGCWKCGEIEFEVGEGHEADEGGVGIGHNHSYANSGHFAGGGQRRVNKETGQVMSIKEAFLEDCRQWQKLEGWKDEWYNGDIAERGVKLLGESRWATTDD